MTSKAVAGKVVIVTGAGRGIGRDVAVLMARQGAKVVVNDLGVSLTGEPDAVSPAQETVELIKAEGGEAVANTDSVADWDGAQRMVALAMDHFGRLDVVVNNAGIIRELSFVDTSPTDFDLTVKVHLYGSFYLSRAAADLFRAQKSGAYIHMTSSTGMIGRRNLSAYAAAKMGVVGLMRSIALDMAGVQIVFPRRRRHGCRQSAKPPRRRRLSATLCAATRWRRSQCFLPAMLQRRSMVRSSACDEMSCICIASLARCEHCIVLMVGPSRR